MSDTPVTEAEVETIKTLAKSDDVWVRNIITRAVERFGPIDKAAALDLLISIKFTDSKEVADEVLGEIGEHGAFKVADLSTDHLKRLIGQLVECISIEGSNIAMFLSQLSLAYPDMAVKLLIDRVEHKEAHFDDREYTPLPYIHNNGPSLRFHETAIYEKLLRQVRDWASIKTDNWIRPHYGAHLFKMMSARFDETTLKVLQEWIVSGAKRKLEAAASFLSEAPHTFVFTHSQYVVVLLEQAEQCRQGQYRARYTRGPRLRAAFLLYTVKGALNRKERSVIIVSKTTSHTALYAALMPTTTYKDHPGIIFFLTGVALATCCP